MPVFALDQSLTFPPAHFAEPDGLLALGGDLSTDRILTAYKQGIFPWYEGPVILWWSPDPRFVLFPEKLNVSKSMKQLLRRDAFDFRMNTCFSEVIRNCRISERKDQDGTWIDDDIQQAYTRLHEIGYALSAECFLNNQLVGGLYGVRIGKIFYGESMFTKVSNASKYAFIKLVEQLKKEGIVLIDCQVYTDHLQSLGAEMIPREQFIELLKQYAREGV